ncbi:NAD(P)-binding protein [Pseudovirgaria hyperparasitica]|uniref:NAD(P)-binding protein n=1 Tax=Pseudovirgaria hyperparasitica TaxID=470096 RepID=A0A6A6WKQ4_9PEZI|nr:NAD(P)-binding protein [Pseudovirgaria hyperparasitica]KAF2762758.1 NAD(P)-binding protein [Pseudovirgaria hyperparasitica]
MADHQPDDSSAVSPYLSTERPLDSSWRITLSTKVIAITGANRGIGLGIAQVALENDAAAVYSLDLVSPFPDNDNGTNPDDNADYADFLALARKHDGRLKFIHTDVTKEASVQAAMDEIVAREGTLNGVVANAGMTRHQPAFEFTEEQIREMFDLNVFGAFHTARAAAQTFQRLHTTGSIVFTASMTSYRPNRAAPSAPYGSTKAAIRNMTHTLAMEWAPYGIRVNSVSPGFVRTGMTYFVDRTPDWEVKMRYYGGMGRLAWPVEVGGAYVYLLCDGAGYTTGIDIPVAGVVGAW